MSERPVSAMRFEERAVKKDMYRQMSAAAYPLLYAASMDLLSGRSNLIDSTSPLHVGMINYGLLRTQEVENELRHSAIPLVASNYEFDSKIRYQIGMDNKFITNILPPVTAEPQARTFTTSLDILQKSFAKVSLPTSRFTRVSDLFETHFSDLNESFVTKKAQATVLDGFVSTFVAALWLSQQPIEGMEALSSDERLLMTLQDGEIVTAFTKAVNLDILSKISAVPLIPERQLRVKPDGKGVALHSDTLSYIAILNSHLAQNIAQPMMCPFAVPLGGALVETTIAKYQSQLPVDVTRSMQVNADVAGVTTAAKVIGAVLKTQL